MFAKHEFAIILPDKDDVHNVVAIQYFDDPSTATLVAKKTFNENAYTIDCSQYEIDLPAVYRDGYFYNIIKTPIYDKDGNITEYKTEEVSCNRVIPPLEKMNIVEANNKELLQMMADIIGGKK